MSHRLIFIVCLAAAVSTAGTRADAAAIEHKPVGCVVADAFPRFEARLTPADSVGRARVFFRGEGSTSWYAVSMTRAGESFMAFLPKPKKSLPRFSYYVEVVDTAMATSRTAEHTAGVAGTGACAPDMMAAPSVATASVLVEAPSGAAAIPAGFSGTGVTAAAPAAAAGVAAGAAGVTAATGGGGIGATTVVVAGAGVAAVGAGAAVATGAVGGDEGDGSGDDDRGSQVVQVRGVVYGRLVSNPANPTGPGLYQPPVGGAVVSTSLDSVTTVTDGNGRFHLVTQTQLRGCEPFTLTITASGWPTWIGTATFHNGESPTELVFAFIPQLPMTPFTGCTTSS